MVVNANVSEMCKDRFALNRQAVGSDGVLCVVRKVNGHRKLLDLGWEQKARRKAAEGPETQGENSSNAWPGEPREEP